MTDYLDSTFDFNDPKVIAAWDELSLWSSFAGSLLLQHVPLAANVRALDVGCGAGFPLLEMAQRLGPGSHVTGIDLLDAALERARQKAIAYGVTNVEIRHADATSLPFDDASFDLIVSNLGLNNFADPTAAIAECARALKPGGRIAITTNLQGHMREFYDIFDATLAELGDEPARKALRTHIDHRATIDRVRALFAAAHLETTAVHEAQATIRFADGSVMLRHYFIRLGFLDDWKAVVPDAARVATFERLEANLNAAAEKSGEIALTIPLAYIEARR